MASLRTSLIALYVLIALVAAHAGVTEVVNVPSKAMKRSFRATFVFPDSYKASGKRYPVVYVLHGWSGNYAIWPRVAPLAEYADKYQVLFVCPDGNTNSWYLNSPAAPASKFETYIVTEVVGFVDTTCRTIADAKGRALMGSSMGGHGALTLIARNPGLFCAAAGISGIMDLTEFPREWDIARVLGDYERNRVVWEASSFVNMIPTLVRTNCRISLDCGTEDFALNGNRKAHALLTQAGIEHDYSERPGGHMAEYVHRNAEFSVLFLVRAMVVVR